MYFLLLQDAGLPDRVKIGEADNFQRRLSQHQKPRHGVVPNLRTLCVVRGSESDEKAVHRYFGVHRYPQAGEKEIFFACDDILNYVRWLREQWFTWNPEDHADFPIASMPEEESSHWLPRADRAIAPRTFGMFTEDRLDFPRQDTTPDDYYTNPLIIEAARKVLGKIDLDPASHAIANRVVRASEFFSQAENGLTREWFGRVWLNPPFSKWKEFLPKLLDEWKSGRIKSMCVLSAMRTVTAQYFSELQEAAVAMCITRGRYRFWGERAGDSPDDGHAIFYFGKDVPSFIRSFSGIGSLWINPLTISDHLGSPSGEETDSVH